MPFSSVLPPRGFRHSPALFPTVTDGRLHKKFAHMNMTIVSDGEAACRASGAGYDGERHACGEYRRNGERSECPGERSEPMCNLLVPDRAAGFRL